MSDRAAEQAHNGVYDTFTFTCREGHTVNVVGGVEQPHDCHAASAEKTQRQVYFSLSPDEDREMWQAFREGRATAALNHIITTHVAREHHAGQAERAAAWDEGKWAAYNAERDGFDGSEVPNPYLSTPPASGGAS